MAKKRKAVDNPNAKKARKRLDRTAQRVKNADEFDAFGPTQPIPKGNAPLVFDDQLPGLPKRPDPEPRIQQIRQDGFIDFAFTRRVIVEEECCSRFNAEPRLCLVGSSGDNTVSAVIDGVYPYFYVRLPSNGNLGPFQANAFRRDCEYKMRRFMSNKANVRSDDSADAAHQKQLLQCEMLDLLPPTARDEFYVIDVQYQEKLPVKGFTMETMPMYKIICRNDKVRRKLANFLTNGIKPSCLITDAQKRKLNDDVDKILARERKHIDDLRSAYGKEELEQEDGTMRQARSRQEIYRKEYGKTIGKVPSIRFDCFEADLNFDVQLTTDLNLRINLWVTFDHPQIVDFNDAERWTDYQIEIHAHVDDLIVREPEGKYEEFGKLYQLSFDGEMRSMEPGFPDSSVSPIINMGMSLRTDIMGAPYIYTGTLVQGPVGAMLDNKETASFTYEAGLLIALVHAFSVRGISADLWTGWNIAAFDMPYIVNRLKLNFATEIERILLLLRGRKKTDAFYCKLLKIAADNGHVSVADMCTTRNVNWIVNQLFPFPKPVAGESGRGMQARIQRMKTFRANNYNTIQDLVDHIRTSRRSRRTLANIGVMPQPLSDTGDHDNEVFYHDLLCKLFPDWEKMLRENGAFYSLMSMLSPFRKGMTTFRCNGNSAIDDAYRVRDGQTISCGKDGVYDASRAFQVYRSSKSRAHAFSESRPTLAPSIMMLDMLPMFRKEEKRRSNGLKDVFEDVMKVKTAEIDYELIPPYHQDALNTLFPDKYPDATTDGGTILANYCGEDARAPLLIDSKKEYVLTYAALGRVTGVDIGDLPDRGASIRSTMLIKAMAGIENMVFPPRTVVENDDSYQGAYVYEPLSNFYRQPVATLDFSSLYPSIIIAYNLCYSTIIELTEVELCCEDCMEHGDPRQCHYRADHDTDIETIEQAAARHGLGPDDYWTLPVPGLYTVKEHIRKGLLPKVCETLLGNRKIAKKGMKKYKKLKTQCENRINEILSEFKAVSSDELDISPSSVQTLASDLQKARTTAIENGLDPSSIDTVIKMHDTVREELETLCDDLNTAIRKIPIFNGRQLSFKLCANSIYGYTGAPHSMVPDRRIALAITTIGMNLILDSASATVDHMKQGYWAPKTRDLRARFAWLEAYFTSCVDVGIAPLATKTAEQDALIRSRLRVGKCPPDVEPFSQADTRPLWTEEPCPFAMPDEYRSSFKAQMDCQRRRTRVLFKHAYDSKMSSEDLGISAKEARRHKATLTREKKRQMQAYGTPKLTFFKATKPPVDNDVQPMDVVPSRPTPVTTSRLDHHSPPLYRSRQGKAPFMDGEELDRIAARYERWSELCCWNVVDRAEKLITQEDLFECIDTSNAQDVFASQAFLTKFRTPGAFKTFTHEDLEAFEPPYIYRDTAKIVYGDTDSIMALLGDLSLPAAHTIGLKLELMLNVFFAPLRTLVQEYEKVYSKYYLREKKKRYTGSLYEPFSLKMKYVDAKGSEAARRDNCHLLVKILKRLQVMMFVEDRSQKEVLAYIDDEFDKIYKGEYDMAWFITTQKFGKPVEEYQNPLAHITLVKTLQKRDPASAPQVGARIPYVFVPAHSKSKTSERVEDPRYALKHKITLDYEYYIKHKFREPLTNALKLWVGPRKINQLFDRVRRRTIDKRVSGNLITLFNNVEGAEVVLHNVCSVCRSRPVVKQGAIEYAVCNDRRCIASVQDLLDAADAEHKALQAKADETWDICRACIKANTPGLDLDQCANSSCQYWFMRTEKQNRADGAKQHLGRIKACSTFADRLSAIATDW